MRHLELVADNTAGEELDALWFDWLAKREKALTTLDPADAIAQGKAFGALTVALAHAENLEQDAFLHRVKEDA